MLQLVLFLVALVTAISIKVSRRMGWSLPRVTTMHHLTLLVRATPNDDWRGMAAHALSRARERAGVQVRILLECTNPKQARDDVDNDEVRRHVQVVHVRPRDGDVVRRLVDQFVQGDETLVIIADVRARLVDGWDELLMLLDWPTDAVLSAPLPRKTRARFPLCDASRRAASRSFPKNTPEEAVPSACWCSEVSVATPAGWALWPDVAHWVPSVPLAEPGEWQGVASVCQATPEARLGLSAVPTTREKILKYESTKVVRLAQEFLSDDPTQAV